MVGRAAPTGVGCSTQETRPAASSSACSAQSNTIIGTPALATWQVAKAGVPMIVLLCAEHAEELAAGRVSWVEQPTFVGAAWPATRP